VLPLDTPAKHCHGFSFTGEGEVEAMSNPLVHNARHGARINQEVKPTERPDLTFRHNDVAAVKLEGNPFGRWVSHRGGDEKQRTYATRNEYRPILHSLGLTAFIGHCAGNFRKISDLHDCIKAHAMEPGSYYCVSGKVKSADNLYLVIEPGSLQIDENGSPLKRR
jgi:hypothetical protein